MNVHMYYIMLFWHFLLATLNFIFLLLRKLIHLLKAGPVKHDDERLTTLINATSPSIQKLARHNRHQLILSCSRVKREEGLYALKKKRKRSSRLTCSSSICNSTGDDSFMSSTPLHESCSLFSGILLICDILFFACKTSCLIQKNKFLKTVW